MGSAHRSSVQLAVRERIAAHHFTMSLIRILVDSFADKCLTNAQMTNARDIVHHLDPEKFHVSIFHVDEPDVRVVRRPNTRLISLPLHRQTPRILREFIFGKHDLVFYLKASPASKWYLRSRRLWKDKRPVVGTVEAICSPHEMSAAPPEWLRLWQQTILRSDYLFSNTEVVKQSLEEMYGLFSGVVATGVDTVFFSPGRECPANPRVQVMFAGSIREYKEPQTVVKAAGLFPEADFVIVGQGILSGELQQRVQREGLTNVRFTGPLSREALRAAYHEADIFFYPSRWEGSPKVIMEAAACGLPVIVRDDYKPDSVINGQTGFVVTSDQELFARLAELLRRPDLRRTLGQAGREHVKKFDWAPVTRQWEEVFLRILSGRSNP